MGKSEGKSARAYGPEPKTVWVSNVTILWPLETQVLSKY